MNKKEICKNFKFKSSIDKRGKIMSLENDKIILETADSEGVGDLVQRSQNRVILDNLDNKTDRVPNAGIGEVVVFDNAGRIISSGITVSELISGSESALGYHYSNTPNIEPSGTGEGSLAIGDNAQTGNANTAIAIGDGARADVNAGIAIGDRALAITERQSVAIGCQARATNTENAAIGTKVQNNVEWSGMFGFGQGGGVTSLIHTKDKGRLHLIGSKAAYNVPTYTVANVPVGSEGDLIYVTNGDAGSKTLAFHDGVAWKVLSLGATISTV